MKTAIVANRWSPVRNGPTYCSPGCGGGCKWVDYVRVKRAAQELSDRLGDGWTPHVHENLGWFGSAITDGVEVSLPLRSDDTYSAIIGEQYGGDGKTPESAIQSAVDKMSDVVRGLLSVVRSLPKSRRIGTLALLGDANSAASESKQGGA